MEIQISLRRVMMRVLLAAAAVLALNAPARAQFAAEFPPVQDPTAARMREGMMQSGQLEAMARGLNGWIRMPRRTPLRMAECPSSDIRWNAEDHAVEICYRMVTRLFGIAAGRDSVQQALGWAYIYMTLHGVAHGIIDEFNVPAGTDPEATVDELSALLIIAGREPRMAAAVLNGMSTLQRADTAWSSWAYATAHGLGPQRFQRVACLVYGADPEGHPALRQSGLVPADARQRCRTAAVRNAETWTRRLGRHLR